MKEQITYRGKTIEIIQDESATSPSEWGDNNLFIVAGHREFYVRPPGEKGNVDMDVTVSQYRETHWIIPVEAYIHSGVRLYIRGGAMIDRQWDVSQVGAIFAAKSEWRLSKSALKAATGLLNEWNMYLSGDVLGYDVEGESCWGFYGHDYCVEEAKGIVDHIIERERKAKLARLKQYIMSGVPLIYRTFKTIL